MADHFDGDKFMAWLAELAEAVGPALIVNSPAGGLLRLAATEKLADFYTKHCAPDLLEALHLIASTTTDRAAREEAERALGVAPTPVDMSGEKTLPHSRSTQE